MKLCVIISTAFIQHTTVIIISVITYEFMILLVLTIFIAYMSFARPLYVQNDVSDIVNMADFNLLHTGASNTPLVIGVGGGSEYFEVLFMYFIFIPNYALYCMLGGSGKSTLAAAIREKLGYDNITYIPHDNYYKDLSHMSSEERDEVNFDHPDALETSLLVEHIKQLKLMNSVSIPSYDFATHTRVPALQEIFPRKIILVEGILLFADVRLVQEMDIKIFVDTDSDIRFIRRLKRDMTERNRTAESVIDQYIKTVRPMHIEFVEPSKRYADIIVPSGLNAVVLDLIVGRLRTIL
jgi:uridine kinase